MPREDEPGRLKSQTEVIHAGQDGVFEDRQELGDLTTAQAALGLGAGCPSGASGDGCRAA